MKPGLPIAFLLAGFLAVTPHLFAQAPAAGQKPSKPAADSGNPFPEDENSVPIMPAKDTSDIPLDAGADLGRAAAPAVDRDPVRSPDDSATDSGGQTQSFSSSLSGVDTLPPMPDDEKRGKHRKGEEDTVPEHHETAKEDESVGQYYLDNHDWRASLSRYQSALVLDPDNPDVYWGLAESEYHLGNFADAKGYYLKVMEYDPGSRHAKDAAKALKAPEMANAKAANVPSAQ